MEKFNYFCIKGVNIVETVKEEIVVRLKQIEKEQKRRKVSDNLSLYNAGRKKHKKQMLFHRCKKRNRWVFGGNRSGKTECGAVESIWLARGNHPYRKNRDNVFGWVVSLSQQVQRDVAQKKILHYLDKRYIEDIIMLSGRKDSAENGIIDQIKIRNEFGSISTIGFKSCDQGREKFQGASLDFVWFDEEPPNDIYDECRMRLLDKKGELFGTMTPLKGLTFIYDEIFLNRGNSPDVWYEFMEWADNPYLSKREVRLLSESMSQDMLESRRYGRFNVNQGLVYSEFDENTHVIEPFDVPFEWQDNISIDPGLNNPLSAHWYAVDFDDNVYVIAEHYEAKRDIDYHASKIKQMCEKLNWHKDSNGNISAFIDSAASQRTLSGAKSVQELFYERGINANCKVNKDLFSGIARVKSYLKNENTKPSLYIFKSCVNLIREFKSYWWGEGDRPKKCDDHALDELRYYIMSKPRQKNIPRQSDVQKNKNMLIRKLKRDRRK